MHVASFLNTRSWHVAQSTTAGQARNVRSDMRTHVAMLLTEGHIVTCVCFCSFWLSSFSLLRHHFVNYLPAFCYVIVCSVSWIFRRWALIRHCSIVSLALSSHGLRFRSLINRATVVDRCVDSPIIVNTIANPCHLVQRSNTARSSGILE